LNAEQAHLHKSNILPLYLAQFLQLLQPAEQKMALPVAPLQVPVPELQQQAVAQQQEPVLEQGQVPAQFYWQLYR
jgi:hypothetical protein